MNIQSLSGAVMKKVMRKKVIIPTAVVVVLVLVGLFLFGGSNDSAENVLPRVKAAKGTIVDKALAIGTIEPENEISVKSKVTGVVRKIYADVGTFVKADRKSTRLNSSHGST